MSTQGKLSLQVNFNAVGKNMSSTTQNFRSNSQQSTVQLQQQQLINQIYSSQQASMRSTLNKGESMKNFNIHSSTPATNGNQHQNITTSVNLNKAQSTFAQRDSEHFNQQAGTLDGDHKNQQKQQQSSSGAVSSVTLQNVLGQSQNTRKSFQNKVNNESLLTDLKNQKRISYTNKTLNFSPNSSNKPRVNHLTTISNFQKSQRNSISSVNANTNNNNINHNNNGNGQQITAQQALLLQLQQQNGSAQFNSNQSQSPYSGSNNNLSGQQITFQHAKGVFSPMKSLFKSQNSLDFTTSTHAQFNKTFQIQPLTTTNNLSTIQQLYQAQHGQQQQQQQQQPQLVLSAKNKDFKGPFFFPSSKKQQTSQMNHLGNNTVANATNSTLNITKTLRKPSVQDVYSISPTLQPQLLHQLHGSSIIESSVNAKGSNSSLDLNLYKLEREQLRERIEKLDQEKNELNNLLKLQTQIKDLAIAQLSRLVEQKHSVTPIEADCFKNIQQLEQQYSIECNTIESLTYLPKQSPKIKTFSEFRKQSHEKLSSDDTCIASSSKSSQYNFALQRQSLPSSPKRKIHFDKVKDKVIQIGQFENISPSKKKLINHDSNTMNRTTNASQGTGINLSNNNGNQFANQGTMSTQNTLLYNQKYSSDDNTKNTSQIIGAIQPIFLEMDKKVQQELQKIKLRMMEVLKIKSECPICSKKSISKQPEEIAAENNQNHVKDTNYNNNNKLKINIQRKSECINIIEAAQKNIIAGENEKDKIKSVR